MSSQRPSFAKRDREAKLKDKARAKAERLAARRTERVAAKNTPTLDEGVTSDMRMPATLPAPSGPQPRALDLGPVSTRTEVRRLPATRRAR